LSPSGCWAGRADRLTIIRDKKIRPADMSDVLLPELPSLSIVVQPDRIDNPTEPLMKGPNGFGFHVPQLPLIFRQFLLHRRYTGRAYQKLDYPPEEGFSLSLVVCRVPRYNSARLMMGKKIKPLLPIVAKLQALKGHGSNPDMEGIKG